MKKRILSLTTVLLMLFCLSACGNANNRDTEQENSQNITDPIGGEPWDEEDSSTDADSNVIPKEDCSSVYAKIVSVDGQRLTVSAGGRTLSVETESDLLRDWHADDEVILFYTGAFGDAMQVHYIDKWTENSAVDRTDTEENSQQKTDQPQDTLENDADNHVEN